MSECFAYTDNKQIKYQKDIIHQYSYIYAYPYVDFDQYFKLADICQNSDTEMNSDQIICIPYIPNIHLNECKHFRYPLTPLPF